MWENLGRVGAEFAHLDRMTVLDFERGGEADVIYDRIAFERFLAIRDCGKPTLVFAAHLANWEVPALAPPPTMSSPACSIAARTSARSADAVDRDARGLHGQPDSDRPRCAGAPRATRSNAASTSACWSTSTSCKGVDVVFFGRWAKANPLIAQLARHTECAIRGVRVVRRPDGNSFWGELTDEIAPARDAEGKIDIQGTMQVITGDRGGLGARASGAMALAASAMAVKAADERWTARGRLP